jgi:alkylated DNA repair protein alkB family protein 8
MCDSQNKTVAVTENLLGGEAGQAPVYQENDGKPIKATNMEKEHVYDVYEKIAPHFSNTRYKGWPKVEEFLNAIPAGSIVADVGCGNGKYLGCNAQNLFNIGTDRSFGLIDCCKQKDISYQTFVADSLTLPLRSACVDRIISIAVVHHFSTDSLRI